MNKRLCSPCESCQPVSPALYCLVFAAQTLWLLGYPDQALARSHEAQAFARELRDTQNLAFAQYYVARTYFLRREPQAALQYAESTLSLSTEQQLAYYTALSLFLRGSALAAVGEVADGVAQMRQGLQDALATGAFLVRSLFVPLLAEGCGALGRFDEAFGLLREVCAMATSEPCFYEAEMYRLQGNLYLQQAIPDTPQAEACFRRAGEIARRQQAKSLELRAAISLCRLWQQQGKHREAYELLAPIYHWFNEGFDTADLQDAKALLAQLSAWRLSP
jgi:predicted ATPase